MSWSVNNNTYVVGRCGHFPCPINYRLNWQAEAGSSWLSTPDCQHMYHKPFSQEMLPAQVFSGVWTGEDEWLFSRSGGGRQ